jgi:hypothetical protein
MSLLVWNRTDYLGDDRDGSLVFCWSWTNSQVDIPCKGLDYEEDCTPQTADRTEEVYESRKDEENDHGGTQKWNPGSRRNPRGTLINRGQFVQSKLMSKGKTNQHL